MSDLIAEIATALARTDLKSAPATTRWMMQAIAERLGADKAFLRLHDHRRRTTMLYAEWPPRATAPEVDPLGVVHFDRASPVIALQERMSNAVEFHGDTLASEHRALLVEAGVTPPASMMLIPVRSAKDITIGVIGVSCLVPRAWTDDDRTLLTTVASLLALAHARQVAELRLSRGHDRDAVTGLPDRAALLTHLADRLSAGDSLPVTALMVRFADVMTSTERLGPDADDEFASAAADRLRVALLGSASVFRTGVDDFVVVPLHGNVSDARRTAVGLQTVLEAPLPLSGDVVVPHIHIGIASAYPDSPDPSALLRGLRQAVTHAQAGSGTAISELDRNIVRSAKRRAEIEAGIRAAINTGLLRLDYQPEVDLRTYDVVGMEALVRWPHPTLGELPPESFLDVVESMNLDDELGRWVLRTACGDLRRWQESGLAHDAVMRVNVSPRQLVDPAFAEFAKDVLDEFGLGPGALCVELTEGIVLHDLDAVRSLVERLRAFGIKVAIDDFGTGYSGFARLKALPVDTVKIDRSFIRDVDVNLHDRAIVAAVTAMAAAFRIGVVAEGVESDGAVATLLELGCTRAQGYLFSPAVTEAEMRLVLEARRLRAPDAVAR